MNKATLFGELKIAPQPLLYARLQEGPHPYHRTQKKKYSTYTTSMRGFKQMQRSTLPYSTDSQTSKVSDKVNCNSFWNLRPNHSINSKMKWIKKPSVNWVYYHRLCMIQCMLNGLYKSPQTMCCGSGNLWSNTPLQLNGLLSSRKNHTANKSFKSFCCMLVLGRREIITVWHMAAI